jgi:hypothetical protein
MELLREAALVLGDDEGRRVYEVRHCPHATRSTRLARTPRRACTTAPTTRCWR